MTAEDWKKVEKALASLYSYVELDCDGYVLFIHLRMYKIYRNILEIFVNGKMSGKYLFEDCEERRRFMRPTVKNLYNKKERKQLQKIKKLGGVQGKLSIVHETITFYEHHWLNFSSLKKHLISNNKEIKLLKICGVTE